MSQLAQQLLARLSEAHVITNLFISLLYLGVSLVVLKYLFQKRLVRNIFTAALAVFFILLSFSFFVYGVWMPPALQTRISVLWFTAASFPAILFLIFRRRVAIVAGEDGIVSSAKFNKLKEEFLSMASHELRTPLSVINGFAEILVREKLGTLNDEQKRRVRKILMQAQRLNRILDELLDLSRIRSGKVEVRRDVFALVPLLKACLDDHQIVCEQQQLELLDKIPDELPDVVGDLERVTQIIVNLLNNAIKYTESHGTITVTASHVPEKKEVMVEVVDTGIGIGLGDQLHVFDEFYRSSHEAARKYSGSGLGLAIVKQLVEYQGGRVGLHSEGVGLGTTFFFTLPVAPVGAVNPAGGQSHPLKPLTFLRRK